ncbi:MAG: hypothetical protein ABSF53_20445 [Terracidiphilus sp.]|jgi:hypothetical protein
MSDSVLSKGQKKSGADEAEATLRLIASLPAPHGLEDRVQARLLTAPRRGRVIAWPMSLVRDSGWMRSAAAAAIVCVVAGGGWGIYARVQGGQVARSIAGPAVPGSSSFSTGEARRRPQTLNGPTVDGAAIDRREVTDPATAKVTPAAVDPKTAAKPAVTKMHEGQASSVKKTAAPASAQQVQ